MSGVLFEVWVSSGAMPEFKIDMSLPAFVFYEGADLTAQGRPLKTDKQITPPSQNAAPTWDGYYVIFATKKYILQSRNFKPQ